MVEGAARTPKRLASLIRFLGQQPPDSSADILLGLLDPLRQDSELAVA